MRFAVVMPLAEQRGGAELFLLHFLQDQAGGAHAPCAVAFLEGGPMVQVARDLGHSVEVFNAGQLRQPLQYARTVGALVRWLKRHRTEVVLSWMAKAHLYAGPAAAAAGVPAIWFQHGFPNGHWMDRLVTALPAAGVLCCSQATQRAQRRLRPRRPSRVVYPTVDLDRFAPECLPSRLNARAALGLEPEAQVVVMVARLQRWKGVHVFIEAATQILDAHPAAQLVVVGGRHALEPDYADEVEAQAASFGESVRLVGFRTDVPLWMQAADVIVHASVGPEPFGMVVLEALALGKPVVAADAAGPRESLQGGEGALTPPGDAAALAGAVITLLEEPAEIRAQRARRARARAEEFSASTLAYRIEEACRELVKTG